MDMIINLEISRNYMNIARNMYYNAMHKLLSIQIYKSYTQKESQHHLVSYLLNYKRDYRNSSVTPNCTR